MDDYEVHQALESMAQAADSSSQAVDTSDEISKTVARWQHLFNLSQDDAMDRILYHRNNLSRIVVSDDHWATIQADKELAGYDREAYEYELNLEKSKVLLQNLLPTSVDHAGDKDVTFLLQLSGPLADVETIRAAAGLDENPLVVEGSSTETWESVRLCCIDARAKASIVKWSAEVGYEPVVLVDPRSLGMV